MLVNESKTHDHSPKMSKDYGAVALRVRSLPEHGKNDKPHPAGNKWSHACDIVVDPIAKAMWYIEFAE